MKVDRKKAFYSISAVAKMFSIHQQTIRLYEKEGLINPKRSAGNTRLFTETDIDRLEEIIYLTHQLGINLSGVEMILKLKKQIHSMQKEMNKVFDTANEQLDKETEQSKLAVKASMKQLLAMKHQQPPIEKEEPKTVHKPLDPHEQQFDEDNWDIEYEEN